MPGHLGPRSSLGTSRAQRCAARGRGRRRCPPRRGQGFRREAGAAPQGWVAGAVGLAPALSVRPDAR
eukprot:10196584-Alexandrium_andersonii.AAC.1